MPKPRQYQLGFAAAEHSARMREQQLQNELASVRTKYDGLLTTYNQLVADNAALQAEYDAYREAHP